MLSNKKTMNDSLKKCSLIENQDIELISDVYIRSQIGFISCSNITNYERISLINNLVNKKPQNIQRITGMCKNKILIKYGKHYGSMYKPVDVIVIPSYLINQWEKCLRELNNESYHILKSTNDFVKLTDSNYNKIVVTSTLMKKLSIWFKISSKFVVNKIILDLSLIHI